MTRRLSRVSGAQLPTWSHNGRALLFVANDGLWLARTTSSSPVEIEHPLYADWNAV